ncbi:MAG: hypothetical protein ACKOYM_07705, partial [Actinomycetes bacterium]
MFGANRTVAAGLCCVAGGLLMFRGLGLRTPYLYVLLCVALMVSGMAASMSPLTAALMSAVPPDRAGAGSAMNDATRELGAALGIAVLGSIAASRYAHGVDRIPLVNSPVFPDPARAAVRDSLGGAMVVAGKIPGAAGTAVQVAAQQAFMSGLHLAVTCGSVLAAVAAVVIFRFLPSQTPMIAGHGPMSEVDAVEFTAELGLG